MMHAELAAILEEVLDGRQLCDMTPDERDDALTKATALYKSGYRAKQKTRPRQ